MVRLSVRSMSGVSAILGIACSVAVLAQAPAAGQGRGGQGRAGGAGRAAPATVVLKVDWQAVPGVTGTRPGVPNQVPVEQGNVIDANVELQKYGAGKQLLTANNDPSSVWSGECEGPFAITFRHKGSYLDLTGPAKIRWTTKTSGFHVVRPVLKLADGTMLVGDYTSSNLPMLAMTEFPIGTIRWIKLDPTRVVTVNTPGGSNGEIWVNNPDLSKVDEVGFADLMPASGHGAGGYIHLGSIEVYGKAVPRATTTSASR
jgi:hypothetical protein